MTLHTTLNDTYHNEWDIWVYPCQQTAADDYVYARTYDEKVKTALQQGKKVLLIPETLKDAKLNLPATSGIRLCSTGTL